MSATNPSPQDMDLEHQLSLLDLAELAATLRVRLLAHIRRCEAGTDPRDWREVCEDAEVIDDVETLLEGAFGYRFPHRERRRAVEKSFSKVGHGQSPCRHQKGRVNRG